MSAAHLLSRTGKSVHILEARDRIGGRIHTIRNKGFSSAVEAGAEFMHGELPMTKSLMKEAKVSYRSGQGQTWNVFDNHLSKGDFFDEGWSEVTSKLQLLREDMTIGDFLKKYFGDAKHESLVESVRGFVQGYDAADVDKASAMALAEEWKSGDVKGYRPIGGYGQLMDFLREKIEGNNGVFKFSSPVRKIRWSQGHVEVVTEKDEIFSSEKILITVPISVLKQDALHFEPPLNQHRSALQQLEMGEVIKFLFEFKTAFWEKENINVHRHMPGLNFLFSDAFVPTWWTQKPSEMPLLTGWLAGPVLRKIRLDDGYLLDEATRSLTYLFGCTQEYLQNELRFSKVGNWSKDEFSRGAYAYKTLLTAAALKTFNKPVDHTIFFAGEAWYDGPEMGTVEAALASGRDVAEEILKRL